MEHERFDQLARAVSSGNTRRKVLGGALAGLFGAGLATVASVDAKKKGRKNRKKASKGRDKAVAEFTCTADNANDVCDNDSCCASTAGGLGPICVTRGTQESGTQQFCGKLNNDGPGDKGSGVCRTCPPGTVCSLDADNEIRCICTPGTCPNGCCINNDNDDRDDECVQNGSGVPVNSVNPDFDGEFVCGMGGSECTVCSLGTVFNGCCDATGACRSGTTGSNCGNSGELCEVCPQGEECGIDQTCTGDGPPPPPPPCAAGLTECPAGSGVCVNLGTNPDDCGSCGNICASCGQGRRRQCTGGSCGCGKKRRKRRRKKK